MQSLGSLVFHNVPIPLYIPLHFEEMIFTVVSPIFDSIWLQSLGASKKSEVDIGSKNV